MIDRGSENSAKLKSVNFSDDIQVITEGAKSTSQESVLRSAMKQSASSVTSVGLFAAPSQIKIYKLVFGERNWDQEDAADLLRGLGKYCEYLYNEKNKQTGSKSVDPIILTVYQLYELARAWGNERAEECMRDLYEGHSMSLQCFYNNYNAFSYGQDQDDSPPAFSVKHFKEKIKDTISELAAYFGDVTTAEHLLPYLSKEAGLNQELTSFYGLQEYSYEVSKCHL